MGARIKVLQTLGRSAGGIARHVGYVTHALDGTDGFEVDIAGPLDLPGLPKPAIELTIPSGPIRGHRRAVARSREIIRRGYDVVHAHGLRAGIDTGLAARKEKVPSLVTVHNLVRPEIAGRFKSVAYRRSEGLVVRMTDRCLAVSQEIAAALQRRGAKGAEVIHLGIDQTPPVGRSAAIVRQELGIGRGRLLVTVARLSPQKAIPVLLRALAQTPPDVSLAILGRGPLEDALRQKAATEGIADRVHWLGYRSDVADYLAAADAFCLSSIWEGIPLAAQEAIQLGTPVVATDVGGMAELITDRRSGRLVPPSDPAALAAALVEVLEDPRTAEEYARHAQDHLVAEFSSERMLERLRDIYTEMAR